MSEALLQMVYEHNERLGAMLWTREDKVRFAELIVRECIRLCDEVDLAGADDCIDNIRDHFGVEE